ncbi:hypothetical protein [Noviherbaspirillum saxi]|uniref:Uncharacterized protein n=1 Tax=Noviherbaspirillum saxi TaxID=2320863 RepID=A0A3A3FKJ7_9BURK|nr:hypothetical protein [Noviherbaspirillum saxi]RJF96048.1 hypothetical protein D3871_22170 [Noviherbaspirillum saxi]RJF96055.1 hypothetical protein D3871_22205 [Noviherbaspirillum saxi]
MKALIINDLSVTEELDASAMAAVRGGTYKGMPFYFGPLVSMSKNDFQFDAEQSLGQSQNTLVNNGNNAAFVSGITSTVKPHQHGTNTINFG